MASCNGYGDFYGVGRILLLFCMTLLLGYLEVLIIAKLVKYRPFKHLHFQQFVLTMMLNGAWFLLKDVNKHGFKSIINNTK